MKHFQRNLCAVHMILKKYTSQVTFGEVFNPSIFYKDNFLIQKHEMYVFQNIYRFLSFQEEDYRLKDTLVLET